MAKFIIEAPHTNQGCLEALDDMATKDPKFLASFNWGCVGGYHTGWAVVDAKDEKSARNLMPPPLRNQARIFAVGNFTREQIIAKHKK
jgi:hypothetical protein